jgi:hypothetical protein
MLSNFRVLHVRRPGADVPKLRDVLPGNAKLLAVLNERPERLPGRAHQRMVALNRPHKNISIDEKRHLPAVWVKILAAERFVRDGSGFRKAVGPLFKLGCPLFRTQPLGLRMFRLFFHDMAKEVFQETPLDCARAIRRASNVGVQVQAHTSPYTKQSPRLQNIPRFLYF